MTANDTHHSIVREELTWSSFTLPLLLALVFVGLPVILAPFDFWDGRILDHALDTQQNAAVEDWFMSSGWAIQYWIFTGVQNLAQATGVSGATLFDLVALFSMGGVVVETIRFGHGIAGLNRNWAVIMGCFVAVFPAWSTLLSSVLFIYVLCTWLILLAARLIFDASSWKVLLGFLILILSFQLNSNFVFAIALGASYFALSFIKLGRIDRASLLRSIAITILAVGGYLILKLSFTPTGLYADYNEILAGGLIAQIPGLLEGIVNYAQYPVVIFIILSAGHVALLILRLVGISRTTDEGLHIDDSPMRPSIWPTLLAIFLIGAAAFPYVVVGKSSNLSYIYEWNQRHTVLLALPAAFFLVLCARLLATWFRCPGGLCALLPAVLAVAVFAGFQLNATSSKLARGAYEAGMIAALEGEPAPGPGVVLIKATNMPEPGLRFYESNWLMVQAYDREDWYTLVGSTTDREVEIRDWMTASSPTAEVYRMKHIMRTFKDTCITILEIEGAPYGPAAALGWLASGSVANRLQVRQLRSDCNLRNTSLRPRFSEGPQTVQQKTGDSVGDRDDPDDQYLRHRLIVR